LRKIAGSAKDLGMSSAARKKATVEKEFTGHSETLDILRCRIVDRARELEN
jgi:hypothetical protein